MMGFLEPRIRVLMCILRRAHRIAKLSSIVPYTSDGTARVPSKHHNNATNQLTPTGFVYGNARLILLKLMVCGST
jgi:hypothetical protein